MSLTLQVLSYLSGRSRRTIWLIVLGGVLLTGSVDLVTDARISVAFFYLLPVSLAAWALGKKPGRLIALLSALAMQSAHMETGVGGTLLISLWNFAVRLAVFVVVSDLVYEFHHLLSHQTELSSRDPLTGSLNRRAFIAAGENAIEHMRKSSHPLTLAFLDVDNFKAVNDDFGHAAGDALMRDVADCLKSQLWGTDTVARLGGDEFGILLTHTDPTAAQKVMPRLQDGLRQRMADENWPITFSFGVVTCTSTPPDLDHLIHTADRLMYQAKRLGKDRIEYGLYPEPPSLEDEESDRMVPERVA